MPLLFWMSLKKANHWCPSVKWLLLCKKCMITIAEIPFCQRYCKLLYWTKFCTRKQITIAWDCLAVRFWQDWNPNTKLVEKTILSNGGFKLQRIQNGKSHFISFPRTSFHSLELTLDNSEKKIIVTGAGTCIQQTFVRIKLGLENVLLRSHFCDDQKKVLNLWAGCVRKNQQCRFGIWIELYHFEWFWWKGFQFGSDFHRNPCRFATPGATSTGDFSSKFRSYRYIVGREDITQVFF